MWAVFYYPSLLLASWVLYLSYKYITNLVALRKVGFPIIHIPLVQQNHPIWMVFGPVTRLWLKERLPEFIFDKIALTIYGLEFYQRHITWKKYVEPQARANPRLLGNGKTYTLATSGRLELWTYDAEFSKEICARPKDFRQFDIGNIVLNIFGDNVLTSDGSDWSRHRRVVAGAVTERVSSVVWNESIRQARDLLAAIRKSENSGTTYRMFDSLKRAAINVLYAAGMGKTQDFTLDASTEGSEQQPSDIKLSYFDAIRIVNENTAGPIIFPTSYLRNYPSFLPGSRWFHEIAQAKIDFLKHTRRNLDQEREIASSLSETRNNVMSALLNASERNEGDPEKGASSRKGPALTDEELVGNLFIFTVAGFDTTANTLAFALILLTRYPKWQSWLIEELDSILPAGPSTAYDYQKIFPQSYRAQAIMFETLRLFPPINHILKQTKSLQKVHLPTLNQSFTIPANTTVCVNLVALHTDPSIWRNLNMTPLELKSARDDEDNVITDEHLFRPSRWINTTSTSPGSTSNDILFRPPPGTFLPWSSGPRVCPGMKMAQVEFVGILTTLFATHRVEAVRGVVRHKNAGPNGEVVEVPESDDAVGKRLDAVMEGAQPKLTLEMDLFNVEVDGPGGRGLGLRWVGR